MTGACTVATREGTAPVSRSASWGETDVAWKSLVGAESVTRSSQLRPIR